MVRAGLGTTAQGAERDRSAKRQAGDSILESVAREHIKAIFVNSGRLDCTPVNELMAALLTHGTASGAT